MANQMTTTTEPPMEALRMAWQTPALRALSASSAENNVGGSVPDAEGTS